MNENEQLFDDILRKMFLKTICVGDGPKTGGLPTISAVIVGRPPGIVLVPT